VFAAAVFINDDTGKPEGDGALNSSDVKRDEISKQVPALHESGERDHEKIAKDAAHDQQEVIKALHRGSQPRVEFSPRGKESPTPTEDGLLKGGRTRLPKPV
jgi:hypothetical protein